MEKRLLMLRKRLKMKKPDFIRCESWRYVRVKPNWRRPRGIDNKMREKEKGWPKSPNVGYRAPRKVRGLHPSGFKEVIVWRAEDLEKLDPNIHAIRIAGTVGRRKALEIMDKAEERGFWVLNPRIVREEIEKEILEETIEKTEEVVHEEGTRLSEVEWIDKESAKKLEEVGVFTLEALADEDNPRELSEITGIALEKLEEWIKRAREECKEEKK
ncbi:MAG: 50S ribosomal protein L32e [Candidatus Jordarchaeales archaeon]